MQIYPAIDLKSGECVRLYKGSFEDVTAYGTDPVAVAQQFKDQGAEFLHVIDLDGAKNGEPAHTDVILDIVKKTGLQVQMGGGIRYEAFVRELLDKGISRVILGSIAMTHPQEVKEWLEIFGGEKIVLALDVRVNDEGDPLLASHGWQEDRGHSLWELLDEYRDSPLKHVLCTDIGRDGTLQGPNVNLYRHCCEGYPQLHFQASGGMGSLADLQELKRVPVSGVVIGKALYEKRFTLSQAIEEVRNC